MPLTAPGAPRERGCTPTGASPSSTAHGTTCVAAPSSPWTTRASRGARPEKTSLSHTPTRTPRTAVHFSSRRMRLPGQAPASPRTIVQSDPASPTRAASSASRHCLPTSSAAVPCSPTGPDGPAFRRSPLNAGRQGTLYCSAMPLTWPTTRSAQARSWRWRTRALADVLADHVDVAEAFAFYEHLAARSHAWWSSFRERVTSTLEEIALSPMT